MHVPVWLHIHPTQKMIWDAPFIQDLYEEHYRKGKVHPSLPIVSDHLAFLPATLFTLTVEFFPEIGRNGRKPKTVAGSASGGDHPASFNCNCFRCYMSYWVQWDSSPNHQIIHEILDGFEDRLIQQRANSKSKKGRRRRGTHANKSQVGMLCTSHSQGHWLRL
ncbi:hypothetical protein NE237_015897 [Protea cynaroides]|uniref:Uncharacterized protein n=1 Tax=Protea cynaroides TaxID=273540 RepID=A0A9Q0KF54_9MAGN|nr:hypothetical protein NE237_015897 [Protea cynaroides]